MRTAILWVALAGAALASFDSASAQNVAAAAGPPSGSIAAAQEQLNHSGFAAGPVNGVMTEETRRAIAAYRRRNGRPPEALTASGDPVANAQAALRRLGLLTDAADGALGPATRDAIIRFQAARRLPIDPRVSDRLLAALAQAGPASEIATAAAPASVSAQASDPIGRRPLPSWVNPPAIR